MQLGRTARIGNEGLATSFYNHDKDSDLAPDLVKILMECKQNVPEFLEDAKPADGIVAFDDDTDNEGENSDEDNETGGASNGNSWGGQTGDNAHESFTPVAEAPAEDSTGWNAGSSAW
jgi:ATP-dependent RNA helicase DDX3X